jgi:two-component system response regulator
VPAITVPALATTYHGRMSTTATGIHRPILLVEDNPHDEELTLRALQKSDIVNPVIVAHDGADALDYLFARGRYAGSPPLLPQVVLLDLG